MTGFDVIVNRKNLIPVRCRYSRTHAGGEPKEMHLLITYHQLAPGSIVPPQEI